MTISYEAGDDPDIEEDENDPRRCRECHLLGAHKMGCDQPRRIFYSAKEITPELYDRYLQALRLREAKRRG